MRMLPAWLASLIFFSVLGTILASQVFWFRRARRFVRSRRLRWQRWALGVPIYAWFSLLGAMLVFVPLRWLLVDAAPVLLSLFMLFRRSELMMPIGLWLTASMLSFALVVAVQSAGWLGSRWPRRWRGWRRLRARGGDPLVPERRHFLQAATNLAAAVPFAVVGYGFLIERQNYQVKEVTIAIPNLPEALDGLRLLLITDVHASAYMPVPEIRRIVGMCKELPADLVFHTGDFTTSRGDPLTEAVTELVAIQGRYGNFGCLGNHEIYAGTTRAATELFARGGVRILRGENAEVEIGGAKLNLIGVDYQRQPNRVLDTETWWKTRGLPGIEKLVRRDCPNLLLTHNPNPFLRAAELGIELTLAGHTHGGQVQVEILNTRFSPARFMTRFISGLYSLPSGLGSTVHDSRFTNHCSLYVSAGVGTIGTPIRLGVPPEITLLTLRRVASGQSLRRG